MRAWPVIRGLLAALGLSLACQLFAARWIVTELSGFTARIARPYNDLWYALAVNAPAAVFWFWCFSRPAKGGDSQLLENQGAV
jgi:hypothetical protein